MSDRKYFRVNPGPVLDVIQDAIQQQNSFVAAMREPGEEFGGAAFVDVWTYGSGSFYGILFKGELPEGWRQGKQYAVPNLKTKTGKALQARFRSLLTGVGGLDFSNMLHRATGGDYYEFSDGLCRWTIFEKHGDAYVLSVPVKCDVQPPSCDPLKMSDYWAIRESVPVVSR
jgi:hypothetical protein